MLSWLAKLEKGITYLAMIATFILMVLTTADAVFRYIINYPIMFAYEITESYLLPSAVFLAVVCAYRGGNLIQVTFFVDRLPLGFKNVLRHVVHAFTTLLTILFLVAMFLQTQYNLSKDIPPDTIPVGPGYLVVTIALLIASLALIVDLVTNKSVFFKKESDNL
jgi:TRAP-type C4-dicarboxylate transport system permease small subunit